MWGGYQCSESSAPPLVAFTNFDEVEQAVANAAWHKVWVHCACGVPPIAAKLIIDQTCRQSRECIA
jgi:hypothetical protein